MKTTIVTTTIFVPEPLVRYAENARQYGHQDVSFIVVGDRKTPAAAADLCARISRDFYPCEYMDLESQKRYLSAFPRLWEFLPFDSIQRRNVGLLKAWQEGASLVITVDDDNLVSNQDFIAAHAVAGTERRLPVIESTSGWYNVCDLLTEANNMPFYHRGFPAGERWKEDDAFVTVAEARRKIAVNAGFWLDDPDIDALTRIYRRIIVKGMKNPASKRVALESGTWSPFNSQNTALAAFVIPAYFVCPYVGRYDDIWPSYLVTRIAQHLGHVIAYGEPLVRQIRNPHNLWRDLDNERNGVFMTDGLCLALRSLQLRGTSYHECLGEIIDQLPQAWQPEDKWDESMKQWRSRLIEACQVWHETFDKLISHSPAAGLRNLAQATEAAARTREAERQPVQVRSGA